MPTVPVGDLLRSIVPTRWVWVRRLLELVKGVKIKKGSTEILLDEKPGRSGTPLDLPHDPTRPRGRQG